MNTLDKALATDVMGYEFFELRYWEYDAGVRQNELKDWLDTIEKRLIARIGFVPDYLPVGDYYIDVEKNICLPVNDFRPSADMRHAWQVVLYLRSRGIHTYIRPGGDTLMPVWECEVASSIHHTAAQHRNAEVAICQAVLRFRQDWGIE